jgi:hypothetical protein
MLEKLLVERRSDIIKKWIDIIIQSYPIDSRRFIAKEKNSFANPVGSTIAKQTEILFEEFLKGEDQEKVSSCLDSIIRIRAVQDFEPSQAVAFVLQLKEVIRAELSEVPNSNGLSSEMPGLEKRIDDLALLAFDIYMKCKQKISDLRVNEVKRQVASVLKRANMVVEIPDDTPET